MPHDRHAAVVDRLEADLHHELGSTAPDHEHPDLPNFVLERLIRLFDHDEARIRAYLQTPQSTWGEQTPAELTRIHGYDTLDHLLDQVELGRRF